MENSNNIANRNAMMRDEILCIAFWEQPRDFTITSEMVIGAEALPTEQQRTAEGWIIVGGNFKDIMIYSIRNATKEQ